ncbi:unnamed protein product [Mytilus edulis]|uniref:Peptidase C76 domain-containing protein n=1 Tax=Mytilus edulis TaxID=6550 RepID=A0A8S3UDD8_MYTED|nr:unnamed protein product [Mytilus edulis]
MKVVNRRCHQGQIVSNSAGFQCTAIALDALITVCTVNPAFFTPDTIDYIVLNGHQMHHQLISQSNNPTPRFLRHWELPHYVQQNNESIEIHRHENILNGVVGMDSNFPFTTVSIEEALPMAFSISNYFICTFGDITIAIFRLDRSEQWFIFDSHSRNSTGITNPFGTATIIELSNYEQCVQFLRQNYEGRLLKSHSSI